MERAGRTNRDLKKATTEAKIRSKLQLESGKLCKNVNVRLHLIFRLLSYSVLLVRISVKWIIFFICVKFFIQLLIE